MVTYCGICYVFAGFAVNGDTCVSSGRTNPLEEGLKQTGLFRELIGCLRAVARYTKSPREINWKTAVGILDYVFFMSDFGITFQRGSELELVAYADADYASKATDRRSVSGGAVMCAGACVCWFSRTQKCVTFSITEAEYVALADTIKLRFSGLGDGDDFW